MMASEHIPAPAGPDGAATALATTRKPRPRPPEVVPPEGFEWHVQSPYGTLKKDGGGKLVRLEDMHAWLMRRDGIPSASAVARVFGVFAADTNSKLGMEKGAAEVRKHLYLLDLSGYAQPIAGFTGKYFLGEVEELIPYVPDSHFERGTKELLFYTLGLMAGEVWAPHACEIDLNHRLDGYCPQGDFPSVEKSKEILGRFAVPFIAAHALWDWGTVAVPVVTAAEAAPAVVPVAAEVEAAPAAAPAELVEADVVSPETLVRYREQFKTLKPQKRPRWTEKQREYLPGAVQLHGGATELGEKLGLSYERVRAQLSEAKEEAVERAKATPWNAVHPRKTA
ncbi:hypothetical protein QYL93_12410 [Acidovorax sp. A1169]|nr:hypothetical protein [Acidovorax sp. A1169]